MKIKALWGFMGNAALLGVGVTSPKVVRGQVFEEADDEYAHTLVGKGLVEELGADGKPKIAKPKETKPASAAEKKAAAEKEEADRLAAEQKAAADKDAADKETERLAAEQKAADDKAAAEAK